MNSAPRTSYDDFPYESVPLRQTHPDHLATVAALFGFAAADAGCCRVLEIGCASGGNLIPLAASYPEATFVGIDLSTVQVARGAAKIEALGLTNIRLLPMDVIAFGKAHGEFDYVIAHGIYSWVPAPVQDRILALCAEQLTANGIALVSYNTLPGWRMLAIVREAMLYQTRGIDEPRAKLAQARATLDFLADAVPDKESAYGRLLRLAAEHIRHKPDYYVLHEYLETANEAVYFEQFVERAVARGLRYLGDSDVRTMLSMGLPAGVDATLNRIAPGLMRREQFLDFLKSRSFRQSLLIREGATLDRKLSPSRITSLRIAAPVQREGLPDDLASDRTETFRLADGRAVEASDRILKAALTVLAEQWPLAMPFDQLLEAAAARVGARALEASGGRDVLAAEILRLHLAGAAELHRAAPPFVLTAGLRPEASAIARYDASRGTASANLRHEPVVLPEAERALLPLLDGARTRPEIAAAHWPALAETERLQRLDIALDALGRKALLVR
ncbi:MAG TPA: class I SAM-dependent methyltransferase [Casimicrobiaceae bacterium]|jgi:methyltransferase-like protein/2-polyprenyl-3-methyl-5-hydroxy-6-metoxy-1,4-benzoquinol methylase